MSEFDGKVVLVTGCARARGIGRAIAGAFARGGADIVATDVATGGTRNENEEGLEELRLGWKGLESLAHEIEKLGRGVLTLVGDVSRAADAERFVAERGQEPVGLRRRDPAGHVLEPGPGVKIDGGHLGYHARRFHEWL